MRLYKPKLQEKLEEAFKAVLPVVGIVLLLCFSVAPVPPGIVMEFLVGAVFLIVGMMFFTLGAELSMTPMGEQVGRSMTKSRKLWVMVVLGFILGFVITISEPDLQVLAGQVPAIPRQVLILSIACGVGVFLVVALVRMLFGIALAPMLIFLYLLALGLAFLIPEDFLAVAFDSGGVTTGPMTVPFIMAMGVGISSIRNDKHASDDSFGLVALCSVGPILAVLLLGIIFRPENSNYAVAQHMEADNSVVLRQMFTSSIPHYMQEIALSMLPILVFFAVFQVISLKMDRRSLGRILIGLVYTYVGLVVFLTGANIGFMPAGSFLGQTLAGLKEKWIIVPVGMMIGYFIVLAEPAVYVLMKQVEELTDGAVSGTAMKLSLSVGVAISIGLAMTRVMTGISIFWYLIPGYGLALILTFLVPRIFTAIAFDSGGVASGPMTAAFLLPFAMGACQAVGGNLVRDAFGVVAMVAMTPLITIQALGLVYQFQTKQAAIQGNLAQMDNGLEIYGDYDIINL
ncbi:MAG: DUF1538 domain-containing protein [Hungatella sp.]|nr:DUF1538 domain-containing protein [Hungatella sp.]